MADPRIEQYARLLVERCVGVKPGWQVLVQSTPLARPLLEQVARELGRAGAYPVVRTGHTSIGLAWAKEAEESLLDKLPQIDRYAFDHCDAHIIINAPENTREGTALSPEKLARMAKPMMEANRRRIELKVPWVGCQFPTPALAQDARMSLSDFEDFLYGACLLDWDAESAKMRKYLECFDASSEVRIVGEATDIRIGLDRRKGMIDDGHLNMPGGEFFFSPVEDATEGSISFSEFPAVYQGREVAGIRLTFEKGRVVEASSQSDQEFLLTTLDSDEGARVLGEMGIGCNPGIRIHTKNTLFDEKIYGTVHLAIGAGFPHIGGKNESRVHWDMVKDLRSAGEIYCDGQLVQRNGEWLI